MGTYTTNYNLFMPSIGEQGWGELVNGNFTTIDMTMAGLNTRVGTLEGKVTSIEAGNFNKITLSTQIVTTNVNPINTYYTYGGVNLTNPGYAERVLFTIPALPKNVGLINVGDITGAYLTITASGYSAFPRQAGQTTTMKFYANGVEFMSLVSTRDAEVNYNYTPPVVSINGTVFIDGSEDIVITCSSPDTSSSAFWGYLSSYKKDSILNVGALCVGVEPAN